MLTVRKGCEHSTGGFTFEWLFFKIWTLDQFSFELGITCSGHWGLGVIAIIPYLRIVACVPCPEKIHTKISDSLGRKPNCAYNPKQRPFNGICWTLKYVIKNRELWN